MALLDWRFGSAGAAADRRGAEGARFTRLSTLQPSPVASSCGLRTKERDRGYKQLKCGCGGCTGQDQLGGDTEADPEPAGESTYLRIPQEELASVAEEKEVWNIPLSLLDGVQLH